MDSGIYSIRCLTNNKRYIGQSKNVSQRANQHLYSLRHNHHPNKHLQSSFNKHGEESFVIEVLEYCNNDYLTEKEQYWMDKLVPQYNQGPAHGSFRGVRLSSLILSNRPTENKVKKMKSRSNEYVKEGESFKRPLWNLQIYGLVKKKKGK